jgi:hypothetical protein
VLVEAVCWADAARIARHRAGASRTKWLNRRLMRNGLAYTHPGQAILISLNWLTD